VAAVSRLLADLYLETGVARKAEAFYSNSLVLSKAESDEEGEMFAHLALARIYEQAMGNKKSATEHLEAALALATMMGDDVTTGQAKKKLAELKGIRTSKPD
jgi:Tfp pilus assembly protein PilF